MTDKQIVEFPTVAPQDTDFLVKQSSSGTYQKCTFKQASDEILSRIPEETQTIDLPELTHSSVSTVTDRVRLQRTTTQDEYQITIDAIRRLVLEAAYPIGSYYHNHSNPNNPSIIFGFGTWVAVRGRVLVGEGSSADINGNSISFSAGSTGGEYYHTLTSGEMPTHVHKMFQSTSYGGTSAIGPTGEQTVAAVFNNFTVNEAYRMSPTPTTAEPDSGETGIAGGTGGTTQAHNNVQPFQVVYMWRRTA